MDESHRRARHRLLLLAVAGGLVLSSSACYRIRSQLIPSPTPHDQLYRCAQLELGRMGYTLVGADRASGWLHAQMRKVDFLGGGPTAEIYVTVIPGDSTVASHFQLSDNSHAADDADRLRERCLGELSLAP